MRRVEGRERERERGGGRKGGQWKGMRKRGGEEEIVSV